MPLRDVLGTTWRGTRGAARAALRAVDEDVPGDPIFFVGRSIAVGLVLVTAVHLSGWWAVTADSPAAQVAGVGFGMTLAALSLVLLGWVYWRIHLDPGDRGPYLVAVLASVATVGVCTAAFSALTTLLMRYALSSPPRETRSA